MSAVSSGACDNKSDSYAKVGTVAIECVSPLFTAAIKMRCCPLRLCRALCVLDVIRPGSLRGRSQYPAAGVTSLDASQVNFTTYRPFINKLVLIDFK